MKKKLVVFIQKNGFIIKGYFDDTTIIANMVWWLKEYVSFTIYQEEVQDL